MGNEEFKSIEFFIKQFSELNNHISGLNTRISKLEGKIIGAMGIGGVFVMIILGLIGYVYQNDKEPNNTYRNQVTATALRTEQNHYEIGQCMHDVQELKSEFQKLKK